MDVLGSACWLPSWEKDNHKNTETESGKNYPVLWMHLHQTHRESKVPTPENGEHYFLIIIFWWLVRLQLSQTGLFTLAWRATCQGPGGTGRLSRYLPLAQPVIWTWTRILPEEILQRGSTAGRTASLLYCSPLPRSVDAGLISEMFPSHPFYVTMHLYF